MSRNEHKELSLTLRETERLNYYREGKEFTQQTEPGAEGGLGGGALEESWQCGACYERLWEQSRTSPLRPKCPVGSHDGTDTLSSGRRNWKWHMPGLRAATADSGRNRGQSNSCGMSAA